MSIIQSSQFFRYAKPVTPPISLLLELPKFTENVTYRDTRFNTTVSLDLNGNFDVITGNMAMANPPTLDGFRDYTVVNNILTVKTPGDYTLRIYDDMMLFSTNLISIISYANTEAKELLSLGVPFYPEILSMPYRGYARVANDRINMVYIPKFTGEDSFSYRLVNVYGQVTEPECVMITTVEDIAQYLVDQENPITPPV